MTPYYDVDGITIYHGDCRDVLPTLTFDAVVTDPPYGVDAAEWDATVPYELLTAFHPRPTVWFGAAPAIGEAFARFDPPPDRLLIWAPAFTLSHTRRDGIAYRFHPIYSWNLPEQSRTIHDVFTDSTECGNWWMHPATKPYRLMTRCVGLVGNASTILDPFMGSGTTLVAAKNLGRSAIGVELEERYCEIAATRLGQGVLDFGASA